VLRGPAPGTDRLIASREPSSYVAHAASGGPYSAREHSDRA
jgi:hypothetical protein